MKFAANDNQRFDWLRINTWLAAFVTCGCLWFAVMGVLWK